MQGIDDNDQITAIHSHGKSHSFGYGASYVARSESVPLYLPELPLQRGTSAQTPAGKRTDASWFPLPTIGTDESSSHNTSAG